MQALTPAERRGALVVALLLALGAAHDLWRGARPAPPPDAGTGVPPATAGLARDADPGGRPGAGSAGPPPLRAAGRLELNRATAGDLERLPGIGPVLAGRIVAYRERHGPFGSEEELLAVRGIGPRLFERLRDQVTVAGPPEDGVRSFRDSTARGR